MSELGVVVPLKEKAYEEALGLVREGRPFELEETDFARHRVYATNSEIVLVFESPGPSATLRLAAEDRRCGRFSSTARRSASGAGDLALMRAGTVPVLTNRDEEDVRLLSLMAPTRSEQT